MSIERSDQKAPEKILCTQIFGTRLDATSGVGWHHSEVMVIGGNAQWLEKVNATSIFIKGKKELRLSCRLVTLIPTLRKTAEPILLEVISKHMKAK